MSRDTYSCVAFGDNHVRELNLDCNQLGTEALRFPNPTLVDHYMKFFETFWIGANKLVFSLGSKEQDRLNRTTMKKVNPGVQG